MDSNARLVEEDLLEFEEEEKSLRPSSLNEFIGQSQIRENLQVFIKAAQDRKSALDHVLLYGPPGLGKTSIAQIVAKELGVNIRSTSGPILSKAGDLAAILTNLEEQDVLFIDEIHRLSPNVEEVLYSAMEDFKLDIIIGEGPSARSVCIDLPKFTLIGATTRLGLLSNPLRDRFGIPLRLNYYTTEELIHIVSRGTKILNAELNTAGAHEIAKRSRGTPRVALRLLKRVVDYAQYNKASMVDAKVADEALQKLEVDKFGLDSNDYRYLKFIAQHYNGGPVGIETIAAGLSEHKDSIEETIEPYLIQQGFVQRTSRGRVLTPFTFEYLGIKTPINLEAPNLFDDQGQ
jgi:Holliday junction DNA helicase RuvB